MTSPLASHLAYRPPRLYADHAVKDDRVRVRLTKDGAMDPLRNRVFGLLSDLCGPDTDVSPDSLRLLSHTVLGVARDHSPSALFAVRDALPWVAALVELADGADAASVADMLMASSSVRALNPDVIQRRLEVARQPRASIVGAREASEESRLARVLRELSELDQQLVDLVILPDSVIRDVLLSEPKLLSTAVHVCGGEQTEVARRLREALWLESTHVDAVPLDVMAGLESNWDGGVLRTHDGFSERTRRFEISACDHLRRFGFMAPVRVALLYGGTNIDRLPTFTVLEENRAMKELACALMRERGNVLECARGRVPVSDLEGWVRYLAEKSHRLEVPRREAMSFAHYCLHLVNFCDLAATDGDLATDATRRHVMKVEEELRVLASPELAVAAT